MGFCLKVVGSVGEELFECFLLPSVKETAVVYFYTLDYSLIASFGLVNHLLCTDI